MTTTITGNVVREPETRFTQSGVAVSTFSVAVNRKQGDEKVASFFDIVCWRELAENVAESLQKGQRVIVTGRLEQRSWEADDGSKRSKVEIIADEVGHSLRWATAVATKNGDGSRPSAAPAYEDGQEPFRVEAADWMPDHWGEYPRRIL